ncbi:hypothetical protein B296_00000979 [Ensete ventricosum]|uniref:Uncharacterized protein n=1 Tax=Ensete ventricosum TaxID=4639 RepID=A0A427A7W2_ENSVE|nr:hypothetical protein B296_00000979 [Ensete ventricosum]
MASFNLAPNLGIKSLNKFSYQLYLGPISGLVRQVLKSALCGTETVGNGEGCHRGQRCGYMVAEATIEEEGSGGKQGQQEAEKAKGEGSGCD